jgi:Pregnancy-associated plasma protein-A/Secretion system C-terminal sorting domain
MPHMKTKLYFFCFAIVFFSQSAWAQRLCATPQHDTLMGKRYANWVLDRKRLNDSITAYVRQPIEQRNRNAKVAACDVIRIPVVVHIVHNNAFGGATGGRDNPNLADAQILSQIKILNEDYRRKPTKSLKNPLGADAGLEFYLATTDPNGQPTSGITRNVYTTQSSFDINLDSRTLSQIVSWPTDKYLNIWVARYQNNYLGLAQFPSVTGIKGLDTDNAFLDKTDGVYIDFRVFGVGSSVVSKLYTAGRTTTHEIGHWLGLLHTWGDAVCGEDYCDDVPPAESGNAGTICGPLYSTCNGKRTLNMTENFLDYSPDTCMSIFTKCQVDRMRAVFEKSPRRAALLRYACTPLPSTDNPYIEVFPNPTANDIFMRIFVKGYTNYDVELYNMKGQKIYQYTYADFPSWTVTIPTQSFANGTYIIRVVLANQVLTQKVVVAR